jgi:hypothetical protein
MKDELIASGKFVALRALETDEYRYEYTIDSRCDGRLVAVLPIYVFSEGDIFDDYTIVHMEMTPAWGRNEFITPNSITGGFEPKKHADTRATAVAELFEEAGIVADEKRLFSLGSCHALKSSASSYDLFAYSLSDEEMDNYPDQFRSSGDGSYMEQQEWSQVMRMVDVIAESPDPLISIMYNRWACGLWDNLS